MTPTSARTIVRAGSDIDRSGCPAQRHGTASAKHNAGCICPDAALAKYRQVKARRTGRAQPSYVPSTGTSRRLRALQALGWSGTELGRLLGCTKAQVKLYADPRPVHRDTARRVLDLYEQLRRQPPPDTMSARRTRAHAVAAGWATPQQWDGIDIDDPDAESDLAYLRAPEPVLDPAAAPMPAWEDVEWLMRTRPLPPHVDHPWTDEFRDRDEVIAKQLKTTAKNVRRCRAAAGRASGRRAKLTDHDVHEIRRRYLAEVVTGQLQLTQLADAYHVSPSLLVKVLTGAARPHLQLDDIQVDLRKIRTTSTTSPIPTSTVPTNQRDAGRTSESADAASARSEVAA